MLPRNNCFSILLSMINALQFIHSSFSLFLFSIIFVLRVLILIHFGIVLHTSFIFNLQHHRCYSLLMLLTGLVQHHQILFSFFNYSNLLLHHHHPLLSLLLRIESNNSNKDHFLLITFFQTRNLQSANFAMQSLKIHYQTLTCLN